MSDNLLAHFEKELAFIQQSASEFARQHPSAAGSLQLSDSTVDDPLVSRLLSGFAYLNARTQQKLSDDFPEMTDAFLDTLYPHYLRPIPSMAVSQFAPDPQSDDATLLERNTLLETDSFDGQNCRFHTCYPVQIAPIQVDSVSLLPRPFIAPGSNDIAGAGAVLKICLKTLDDSIAFSDLNMDYLRFFLSGPAQTVLPLYDLLFSQCLKIVVAKDDSDPYPAYFEPECLRQVGFEKEESLLPYPDNVFSGYRLLTEYFAFPQKFHFVDVIDFNEMRGNNIGHQLNLYLYLHEGNSDLEHQLTSQNFALGCTPMVNLFEQSADPIPLSHRHYEYPIVPDARRTEGLEIYSIEEVVASDQEGNRKDYRPFYGIRHGESDQQCAYWFARRRPVIEGEHRNETASEMDISLVDLNYSPHKVSNQTLELKLLCSNRNLPKKLPSNGGQPDLSLVDGDAPAERISCTVPPTSVLRPPQRERGYWRLISHLNLNHLSLSQGEGSVDALKEILRLYDFRDSAATRNLIESIRGLQSRPITAPIQIEDTVAMCRGTEIKLELDPLMLSGNSPLLFASVLERFFGLYCSINSFTRLIASLSGKDGELKRWSPRAGEKALV